MKAAKLVWITVWILLAGAALPLGATQPFWSLEPSTREIERADSLTGFDITKYVINLEIDTQTQHIDGMVQAFITPETPLGFIEYELEGDSLTVTQVRINGGITTFTHQNGIIHIPLPPATREPFSTEVYYSGVPDRSPAPYNIGMIFTPTAVYTLSNPDAGRYYWPSYDHPWDKALVDWNLTVRGDWLAAANGVRTGITDNGDGTRTHHWVCNSPVATYVMGFAAGPYIEFAQQAGTLPIQNFVLPGQLNNAQVDFANLPEMIGFFNDTYGAYPFEKYGHMVVNMSTYAAMEHQTMTTFGAAYLTGNQAYESIVAHELTHQWYGNLVTPLTMREVWLKESFATYSEFLWEAYHHGWAEGCDYLRDQIQQYYITWENSNGPHTIFNPEYNLMFAPPTYEKSASVLHMLRLKMGNAAFFQFIRAILTAWPGGNIVTSEFVALAEQYGGLDLDQFFQQWIYSPGIPNAEFSVFHNGAGLAKIVAKSSSPTVTQFDLDVPVRIPGSAVADSVVIRATAAGYVNTFAIAPTDNLASLQIDPNHWLLTRQLTQNNLQLAMCLPYDGAVDVSWNPYPGTVAISGYQVYRRALPGGVWSLLTPAPLAGLSYTDSSVQNGNSYQYYAVAVDEAGFISVPSNVLEATPLDFAFDQGFLLVDETRNGSGANISPSDQMVDDFYAYGLADFAFTQWDTDAQGDPPISVLSHYPLVLWHCDDFTDMQLIDNLSSLGSYVLSGGKLLISGWKYPSVFDTGFINRFLPGIAPALVNSAVLVSAQSDSYPDLHPDPAKLAAPWNGMLPMSYVFPGAAGPFYTAEIFSGGAHNGEALGLIAQNNGSLALLGFPLYFMLQDEARTFLSQFLPDFYPQVSNSDDLLPPAAPDLSCHPNPFSARLTVSFRKDASPATITIYNLRGQVLRTFQTERQTKGEVQWDGRDSLGRPAASGVYLIGMDGPGYRRQLKVLLCK